MTANLQGRARTAASVLSARQVLSLIIAFGGAILVARVLGPSTYGTFVAAVAVFTILQNAAELGADVYLVRRVENPTESTYKQVSGFLLASSVLISAASIGVIYACMPNPNSEPIRLLVIMICLLPLVVMYQVPLSRLERELSYGPVAKAELGNQLLFYGVSTVLAILGWGAWSLLTAWILGQALFFLTYFAATASRPRFSYDSAEWATTWRHGWRYTFSTSSWDVRQAYVSVVILPMLGPSAVGLYALAQRLIEAASPVKQAMWRLSIPLMARVASDQEKTRVVIERGIVAQCLGSGLPLLVVTALIPIVATPIFGPEWAHVPNLIPWLAVGSLVNAAFSLQSSYFNARGASLQLVPFHLLSNILLFSGGLLLIPLLGIRGAALAELACLPSYALLYWLWRRNGWTLTGLWPLAWVATIAVALAAVQMPFGLWTLVIVALPLTVPPCRRLLADTIRSLTSRRGIA